MVSSFGPAEMVNFIGSQDVPRFISKSDPSNRNNVANQWDNLPGAPSGQLPYDRLFMAFINLMTIPNVPLIYYGDEYGEFGGSDPDNRHMLNQPATFFAEQRNQLDRMKRLLASRASLRGLRRGPLVELWCNNQAWGSGQGNLMAYARTDADPKQAAIVVLNLTTSTWSGVQLTQAQLAQAGWTQGGVLHDDLSQTDYPITNSQVTVDVPARGAVILHLK
jgi:hypothetical protein